MLSPTTMQKIVAEALRASNSAVAKFTALDAKVQDIKGDTTLTPEAKVAKVAELRKPALDGIATDARVTDEQAALAVAQRKYWDNKPLLLSQQTFASDPVADATIRLRWHAELATVGAVLLAAIADDARDSGNLPLLWQCVLASGSPPNQTASGSNIPIALDDVEIPGQQKVLDLIKQAEALAAVAHAAFRQASGNILTGVDRLVLGRMQQAAKAT